MRLCRVVHVVQPRRDLPVVGRRLVGTGTGVREGGRGCQRWHDVLHPEGQRPFRRNYAPVTEERWDYIPPIKKSAPDPAGPNRIGYRTI